METTNRQWDDRELVRESGMERLRLKAERRYKSAIAIAGAIQDRAAALGGEAAGGLKAELDSALDAVYRAAEYRDGIRGALWEIFRRADDEYVIGYEYGLGPYFDQASAVANDHAYNHEHLAALSMLVGLPCQILYEMLPVDKKGRRRVFDSAELYERVLPQLGVKQMPLDDLPMTMSEAHRRYGNCVVFWSEDYLHRRGICALIDGAQRGVRDARFCGPYDSEVCVHSVFALARDQSPRRLMLDFVYDDGGRYDAGFRGRPAGDCAVRAAAIVLGRNYREMHKLLGSANRAFKADNGKADADPSGGVAYGALLSALGELGLFEAEMPGGLQMTLTEAHNHFGDCVAITDGGRHMAALMDGAVRDIWDPRYDETRDRRQKMAEAVLVPRGLLL